jgi:hypothetical protein
MVVPFCLSPLHRYGAFPGCLQASSSHAVRSGGTVRWTSNRLRHLRPAHNSRGRVDGLNQGETVRRLPDSKLDSLAPERFFEEMQVLADGENDNQNQSYKRRASRATEFPIGAGAKDVAHGEPDLSERVDRPRGLNERPTSKPRHNDVCVLCLRNCGHSSAI